jgi:hypothetical protein
MVHFLYILFVDNFLDHPIFSLKTKKVARDKGYWKYYRVKMRRFLLLINDLKITPIDVNKSLIFSFKPMENPFLAANLFKIKDRRNLLDLQSKTNKTNAQRYWIKTGF